MTSDDEHAEQVEMLGRSWDGVLGGVPILPPTLDPGLGGTILRLNALGRGPLPDPNFGRRLWEALMDQSQAVPSSRPIPFPGGGATSNGRRSGEDQRPWFDRLRSRRWRGKVDAAAAVLLVVVLAVGVVALGGGRPGDNRGGNVAQDGTPTPNRASWFFGGGGGGPVRLPEGDGPMYIAVREITLQPGAAWEAPDGVFFQQCVLTGLVTYSDRAVPEEHRAGRNSCFSTENLASIANDHTTTAVVLQLVIGNQAPRTAVSPGVTIEELGTHAVARPTSDEASVSLNRSSVSEGNAQVEEPIGGAAMGPGGRPLGDEAIVLVAVESGSVEVSILAAELSVQRAGDDAAVAATPISGGASVPLLAGDAALLRPVVGGEPFAYSVRRVGADDAVVATVTIDPGFDVPRTGIDALPPGATGSAAGELGRFEVPAGDEPVSLLLRRLELEPGATMEQAFAGTVLHEVELGTVAIRFGDADAAETTVGPGHGHNAAGEGTVSIRNDGPEPAVLVQGLVAAGTEIDRARDASSGSGVTSTVLGTGAVASLPAGPANVWISRYSLGGPGGGTGASASHGAEVIAVEEGRIVLTRVQGEVEVQRQPGAQSGADIQSEAVLAGVEVTLMVGDAALALPGAGYSLYNPDLTAATAVSLAISAGDAMAATPGPAGVATPMAPDPTECRVAPRSIAALRALAAATPIAGGTPDPGLRDEIGSGVPADAETAAGVTATIREFVACRNAGNELAAFGLATDNWLALIVAGGGLTPGEIAWVATPQGPGPQSGVLIAQVDSYPDGRVGALIALDGEIAYLTLVRSGDRWLIDAFEDRSLDEMRPPGTPAP